jgi:hypothetical protein
MSDEESNERKEDLDVHDYVHWFLDRADSVDDPQQERDLVQQAIINYVITQEDIEDYEYHYITALRIAYNIDQAGQEFHSATKDFVQNSEPPEGASEDDVFELADSLGRFVVGNNIAMTYSMAYELFDDLMRELLPELLAEEYESGGATLQSQVGSYQARHQLLRASGLLDDEVAGIIDQVGNVRGDLSHDVERRFDLDVIDDLGYINELPVAVNALYEQVYDQPVYQLSELHKDKIDSEQQQ